jgi:hypothetical protein
MIFKCIVFVFSAFALAGCCVSVGGCYPPVPGAPVAWDGLGAAPAEPAEASEVPPKKNTRPKKEIIIGPIGDVRAGPNSKTRADEGWAEQQAADQADETRLKKQLKICTNC